MNVKPVALMGLRMLLLTLVMLISFVVTAALAGLGGAGTSSGGSGQESIALLAVCLADTLVLSYPILRSRWHGPKLMGAVALVYFGIETFMSQIETLFFGDTFNIPAPQMRGIILSGALRALIFSPLAVLILGRMGPRGTQGAANTRLLMPWRAWVWRLALLPVLYVCIYFLFGYFVAWQWPEVRQFYTGSTAILPFPQHMLGSLRSTPAILPFQWLRGLLWIGLALPVVRMMQGERWETPLAIGLLFGCLLTAALWLPNPYMPAPVRWAHFVETSTSTFLYGAGVAWLFSRPRS
jgi:hypothetical protein